MTFSHFSGPSTWEHSWWTLYVKHPSSCSYSGSNGAHYAFIVSEVASLHLFLQSQGYKCKGFWYLYTLIEWIGPLPVLPRIEFLPFLFTDPSSPSLPSPHFTNSNRPVCLSVSKVFQFVRKMTYHLISSHSNTESSTPSLCLRTYCLVKIIGILR